MTLRKQFIHSVLFTAGAKYISLLVQLVITGILSRILQPEDFGIVAIATVFILFFNLLGEVGIGVAIVQNKTLDKDELDSIFSFSIYIGVALALMFFFFSGQIAAFYGKPGLKSICQLLSINILFASFNVVLNALLLREKQFKFIAARTLFVQILAGIVGIVSAYQGLKAYALVIYAISSSGFMLILNYLRNPMKFKRSLQLSAIRKIYRYSVYQFLFNFINYFSRNLDKLLIGKFLSPTLLGFYDKAYRVMMLPVENLTYVLAPVIHPLFSDFQQDKQRIFESYLKIVRVLALVGFPISILLHFTAQELIFIIFGAQWGSAVPPFRILAWSVGLQIVLASAGPIFQAANNTRQLFVSGLLSAIMMVLGIAYGVFIAKSLNGVAYGLLAAFCINFIQCYVLLIRMLNGSFSQFTHLFKTPLVLASLVFLAEYMLSLAHINGLFLNLTVKSLVALLALVAGLRWTGDHAPLWAFIHSKIK